MGTTTVTTITEECIMPMLVVTTMGDHITKVVEVTRDITAEAAATVRDLSQGIIPTGAVAAKILNED